MLENKRHAPTQKEARVIKHAVDKKKFKPQEVFTRRTAPLSHIHSRRGRQTRS